MDAEVESARPAGPLLATLLVVPVVAAGLCFAARFQLDSEFRKFLRKQTPPPDPEFVRSATVDLFAQLPDGGAGTPLGLYQILGTIFLASVFVAALGLALFLWVRAQPRGVRGDRARLADRFARVMRISGGILPLIVLLHGAVIVGTMLLVPAAVGGGVPIFLVLAVGAGAFVGAAAVQSGVRAMQARPPVPVFGFYVERDRAPELWAEIESAADRLGSLRPDHVVAGLDANFFVTEASVRTVDEILEGRTIFCSLPLSRILSRDEWRCVIGHELAHFKGEDTVYSQRFAPSFRGAITALIHLKSRAEGGAHGITMLPAISLYEFLLGEFGAAEREISRERELLADRIGSELAGARDAASALVKCEAFSPELEPLVVRVRSPLGGDQRIENLSEEFVRRAAAAAPARKLAAPTSAFGHPIDTHPPLARRLEALGVAFADVEDAARAVEPEDSGASAIACAGELERELTRILGEPPSD